MRWVAIGLVVCSVMLMMHSVRVPDLASIVGWYLVPSPVDASSSHATGRFDLSWLPWVCAGALAGVLLAQGDLFLPGGGRSPLALGALGAGCGWLLHSMHRTKRKERRARELRFELPVLADALALRIISGESVAGSIADVVDGTSGVGSDEFADVLLQSRDRGLSEALLAAESDSAHQDSRRLYELLAHAHLTGGRLADSLLDLGADYRAELERDMTRESGRRMVTVYGPILALMVPTTLLFLLYPTLLGLRALSGAP